MEDAKRLNGGDGLKPCPFCGKVAEIFQFDYFWGVRCAHENCVGHDIEAYYDNADFAIKAWNKRMNTTEVVHGRWDCHASMARTPFALNYDCSICGEESSKTTNYCPNCGAKMDGDGNG